MAISKFCYCSALALALLAGNFAGAQPTTVSLHPREEKLPAPKLEDRSGRATTGGLPLLDCLDGLVRAEAARAERSCSNALALNPGEHDAYKLRGYAYLMEHRFERASADFQAALRLKPQDDEDRAGFAQSLSGQGLFSQAVVQYRKAVVLAPAKAPYWSGLCWARAGTGRQLDLALKDCNRALAIQPDAAGALNSRGLVYLRMKYFGRAISDYSASLAAGPLQASARFGRGLAQLYVGRIRQGGADILEARRRDADVDDLYILLGVLPRTCADSLLDSRGALACPLGFPPQKAKPLAPASLVAALAPGRNLAAAHMTVRSSGRP